ncbi:hypothetical protein [Aeromonas media]|uniref:leucine-rich repeat domain-containing protein n=1 Tax=Aeromonas media TaxID=651 RepID=UPI003D1C1936
MKSTTMKYLTACLPFLLCLPASAISATGGGARYEFKIPVSMEKTADESGREWRDFFLSANSRFKGRTPITFFQYSDVSDEEWKRGAWSVSFAGGLISNSELPKSSLGTKTLGNFLMSYQMFTNVDFLSGVEELRHNLYLNGNKIENLKGMRSIKKAFHHNLVLSENKLKSLDGLENLRQIRRLDVHGNPELVDISAIRNIELYGVVYVDDVRQYKIKPPKGSPFCNSIKNRKVFAREKYLNKNNKITEYLDGQELTESQICM